MKFLRLHKFVLQYRMKNTPINILLNRFRYIMRQALVIRSENHSHMIRFLFIILHIFVQSNALQKNFFLIVMYQWYLQIKRYHLYHTFCVFIIFIPKTVYSVLRFHNIWFTILRLHNFIPDTISVIWRDQWYILFLDVRCCFSKN